jgi:hypothetical protein
VFDRPAAGIGPLPSALSPARQGPCLYLPDSLRLLVRGPAGRRFYAARTLSGGVFAALVAGGATSSGCTGSSRFPAQRRRDLARIERTGVVARIGYEPTGRRPAFGLVVLDGFTRAIYEGESYPIRDNGVIIEGIARRSATVTLEGPAGKRTVPIFG